MAADIPIVKPTGVDDRVACAARIYDYWLGGKDNFAIDREVGDHTREAFPEIIDSVRANRAFLARAVRYFAAQRGIRQFLDIGTGIPTAHNTHEVAQAIAPDSRVVYVDNDPMVLSHAEALLHSTPQGMCDYLYCDIHDTRELLKGAARTLDFSKPIALIALLILHFTKTPRTARTIVGALTQPMVPGSGIAISHPSSDLYPAKMAELRRRMNKQVANKGYPRDHAHVSTLFGEWELQPPGLVPVADWRPRRNDPAVRECALWGGVAIKR